jgi:hypothetical protein
MLLRFHVAGRCRFVEHDIFVPPDFFLQVGVRSLCKLGRIVDSITKVDLSYHTAQQPQRRL